MLRDDKWRVKRQYMVPDIKPLPLTRKQKDTLLSPIPRNITTLLTQNVLMSGDLIEEFLSLLVASNPNTSFMGTDFGPRLQDQGQLYWEHLVKTKHGNYVQRAMAVMDIPKHIMYIPWFTGETTGGHWSLIVRTRSTRGNVTFHHIDSLNRFDSNDKYALSNTPMYSQNRDSWHNVRTSRQTEMECGMRLCLAATMIAQFKGTIQKRVKNCMEVENLGAYAREYVVKVLTSKTWLGI